MRISRREALVRAALAAAGVGLANATRAETDELRTHGDLPSAPSLKMYGEEEIGFLLYPELTALDLVGPHHFLAGMMGARVHVITNQPDLRPVTSDLGLVIHPTVTFETCPERLTALVVPGGTTGTLRAASDERTVQFVQRVGGQSRLVTSVCTGALILGVAGLLKHRRATSHWSVRNELERFGALPQNKRVVHDGNIITGAGVTAGMDLAISLVASLRGDDYALASMLTAEYAPEPPFGGGTPNTTPPEVLSIVQSVLSEFVQAAGKLKMYE